MGRILCFFTVSFTYLALLSPFVRAQDAVVDKAAPVQAMEGEKGKTSSGLPIPRFVTLGSEQVFVRTGPALRYPIKWVYKKEGLPVEIIQEFDTWRKIRDIDGDTGWIHQSLLSGARSAIIRGETGLSLRREAEADAPIVAVLEPAVVAKIDACKGGWCELESGGYKGWAERKFLWGIYDSENFD